MAGTRISAPQGGRGTIGPTLVALALAASVPLLLAIGEDSVHRDAGRDLAELASSGECSPDHDVGTPRYES
jgi:hypothetical protein